MCQGKVLYKFICIKPAHFQRQLLKYLTKESDQLWHWYHILESLMWQGPLYLLSCKILLGSQGKTSDYKGDAWGLNAAIPNWCISSSVYVSSWGGCYMYRQGSVSKARLQCKALSVSTKNINYKLIFPWSHIPIATWWLAEIFISLSSGKSSSVAANHIECLHLRLLVTL